MHLHFQHYLQLLPWHAWATDMLHELLHLLGCSVWFERHEMVFDYNCLLVRMALTELAYMALVVLQGQHWQW